MDRASELRALMKAKSVGGTLTGKDKAKYLKSLREGQKEKLAESRPPSYSVPTTPAHLAYHKSESANLAAVKQVRFVSIPSLASPLKAVQPNATVAPISAPAASSNTLGIPSTLRGLVEYTDEDDNNEISSTDASSSGPSQGLFDKTPSSGLPAGFFDEESSLVSMDNVVANQKSQTEAHHGTSYSYDAVEQMIPVQPKQSRINAADEYTGDMIDFLLLIVSRPTHLYWYNLFISTSLKIAIIIHCQIYFDINILS